MTESDWFVCSDSLSMLSFLKGAGRAKLRRFLDKQQCERKQRLFLCACARRNWNLMSDQRSRTAVEVVERHVDGSAKQDELKIAHVAAAAAYAELRVTKNVAAYCAACLSEEASRPNFRNGFVPCIYGAHVAPMAQAVRGEALDGYDENVLAQGNAVQAQYLRDIFGNPFDPVTINPSWLMPNVTTIAQTIYNDRAFDRMPELADALQEAGCDHQDLVSYCRGPGPPVKGCWVVDLLLGKE